MLLILYSKPGCHLCEVLAEKLTQLPGYSLEIRDIHSREDWLERYAFEIPVLAYGSSEGVETILPRISPRATVHQVAQVLQQHLPGGVKV